MEYLINMYSFKSAIDMCIHFHVNEMSFYGLEFPVNIKRRKGLTYVKAQ